MTYNVSIVSFVLISVSLFLFASRASSSEKEVIDCEFRENIVISLSDGSASRLGGIYSVKLMQLIGRKSSPNNFSLDGAVRATNSKEWIELDKRYKKKLTLAGSDGDLLNIDYSKSSGSRRYRSTLSSSHMNYSTVYIGFCQVS